MAEADSNGPATQRTCANCSAQLQPDAHICPHCGSSNQPPTAMRAVRVTCLTVVFGSGIVLIGAMGACFTYFGVVTPPIGGIRSIESLLPVLGGIVLIAIAVWLARKLITAIKQ